MCVYIDSDNVCALWRSKWISLYLPSDDVFSCLLHLFCRVLLEYRVWCGFLEIGTMASAFARRHEISLNNQCRRRNVWQIFRKKFVPVSLDNICMNMY